MKTFLFTLIIMPLFCLAQQQIKIESFKKTEKPQPIIITKTLNDVLSKSSSLMPAYWKIYWLAGNQYEKPISPDAEIMKIENKIDAHSLTQDENYYGPYAENIIKDIENYGDQKASYFPKNVAYDVCKNDLDHKGILLINGASSGNVYNTLRLTTKQRVSNIFQQNILPALKSIHADHLKIPDIYYLSVSMTYASKDLTKEDDDLRVEYLCVVLKINDVIDFINNTLSYDEMLSNGSVYLKSRDDAMTSKILIQIE